MIDRLWCLWQLRHPGAGPPRSSSTARCRRSRMTVRQTLDIRPLGYDYAASTAAAADGHG